MIAFCAGLFIGAILGIFYTALMVAASRADEQAGNHE